MRYSNDTSTIKLNIIYIIGRGGGVNAMKTQYPKEIMK